MIPDITWEKPKMFLKSEIVKGAAYKGDGVFAIEINAGNQLITFESCIFSGTAHAIAMLYGGSRVIFNNCEFYALPNPVGQFSRSINAYEAMQIEVYNCYMEHTGGNLIEKWGGPLDAPLKFQRNRSLNVDKRKADGSVNEHRAFFMIKGTNVKGELTNVDISWNESICNPNESYIEDHFNFMDTRGSKEKPILLHDNYIYGAYPFPATSTENYSGSGITTDSDGQASNKTADLVSANIRAYNNYVLECCNGSMNIATGKNVKYNANIILHSGKLADGTIVPKAWAGPAIYNSNLIAEDVFVDNEATGNDIGYMNYNVGTLAYPYANRHDEMNERGLGQWQNRMPKGGNNYRPDKVITNAEVKATYSEWLAKAKAAGVTIGVNGGVVAKPDLSIQITKKATSKVVTVNDKGETVTFKKGSLKAVSSDVKNATIAVSADELSITVTPIKIGTATGTLSLIDNQGNTFSKTFSMEVLAATPTVNDKVTDIKLEFVIS